MNNKENKKEKIAQKISEILPNIECPMCHNRHFAILDGYLVLPVPDDYKTPFFQAKKSIPAIGLICTKCGFISQHALGILGLLEHEEKKIKKAKTHRTVND